MIRNELCPIPSECAADFIQVSKNIAPNTVISPTAVYGNPDAQSGLRLDIFKDTNSNNWWVACNSEPVGYFPSDMIGIDEANTIAWGGMVHLLSSTSRTQMGNGNFPGYDMTKAAAITHARVKKPYYGYILEAPSGYLATHRKCFDIIDLGPDKEKQGYNYVYGGPGNFYNLCT